MEIIYNVKIQIDNLLKLIIFTNEYEQVLMNLTTLLPGYFNQCCHSATIRDKE